MAPPDAQTTGQANLLAQGAAVTAAPPIDVLLRATWIVGVGGRYDVILDGELIVRRSRDPEHDRRQSRMGLAHREVLWDLLSVTNRTIGIGGRGSGHCGGRCNAH